MDEKGKVRPGETGGGSEGRDTAGRELGTEDLDNVVGGFCSNHSGEAKICKWCRKNYAHPGLDYCLPCQKEASMFGTPS